MKARLEILGSDVFCRADGSGQECRIDEAEALAKLRDWSQRYDRAVPRVDAGALLRIGQELFGWLDRDGWASAWAGQTGPRMLEIIATDLRSPLAQALLDAPWELLADAAGHLADDEVQDYQAVRRIGMPASPLAPPHRDLSLLFMAAAPEHGGPLLAFEDEEAAVLDATARLPLHLLVEESGNAGLLGERLDLDGPFDVLHLSCHGDRDDRNGPVLQLEDETGRAELVGVGRIARLLGDGSKSALVFLSACRTAESGDDGSRRAEPFVCELVRAGVANVLGWDGSVFDSDARDFARHFYERLAHRDRVPQAVAAAVRVLRQANRQDPRRGAHWHLARLYLGPATTATSGSFSTRPGAKFRSPPATNSSAVAANCKPCCGLSATGCRRRCCSTAWATSANPASPPGSPAVFTGSTRSWCSPATMR